MTSTLDDDLLESFADSPLQSPAFKALRAARQQCEADLIEAFEPSPVAMNTHRSSHVSPDTESNLLLPFGDNTNSVALHSTANEFTQLAEHLAAGHGGDDEFHDEDLLDDMFEPEHKAGSLGFSDSNSDSEEEDASNERVAITQSTLVVSQKGALVGTSGRASSSKSSSIASSSSAHAGGACFSSWGAVSLGECRATPWTASLPCRCSRSSQSPVGPSMGLQSPVSRDSYRQRYDFGRVCNPPSHGLRGWFVDF